MRCLEKDRDRRYETANGLARDVERYLNDEPVQACPPSALYRFRKLVRRHKAAVLVVAAISVLLVVGVVVSTTLAVWAIRAEGLAEDRLNSEKAERTRAVEAGRMAHEAERERRRQLVGAKLAQARAGRWSRQPGQRFEGVKVLTEAAALARELGMDRSVFAELRNEMVACLGLADIRLFKGPWEGWPAGSSSGLGFDADLERYAQRQEGEHRGPPGRRRSAAGPVARPRARRERFRCRCDPLQPGQQLAGGEILAPGSRAADQLPGMGLAAETGRLPAAVSGRHGHRLQFRRATARPRARRRHDHRVPGGRLERGEQVEDRLHAHLPCLSPRRHSVGGCRKCREDPGLGAGDGKAHLRCARSRNQPTGLAPARRHPGGRLRQGCASLGWEYGQTARGAQRASKQWDRGDFRGGRRPPGEHRVGRFHSALGSVDRARAAAVHGRLSVRQPRRPSAGHPDRPHPRRMGRQPRPGIPPPCRTA